MTQHGKQELLREIEELRVALREQWEEAHFDHCGLWPHPRGVTCLWPMPEVLARDDPKAENQSPPEPVEESGRLR